MGTSGLTELRVCLPLPPYATMAHLLLTGVLGYAEEEGLDLSFHFVDGPDAGIEGVGAGQFDLAIGSAVFAFRMREREVPVRAIYSTCRAVYRSFAVLDGSPISTVAEMRGRSIGTDYPDLLDLAFPALRAEGLDPNRDVMFHPRTIPLPGDAPSSQDLERIASGKLDAIWVLECGYQMLLAEGIPLRKLPMRTLDVLTPSELMYAHENAIREFPHALAGFGRALAKTSVFCGANPEAAVRLVWEHFPASGPASQEEKVALHRDVAGLRGRTERGLPEHGREPSWGAVTLDEVQAWEDFLIANGGIERRHPLGAYFSSELVETFNDFDADAVVARARQWPGVSQGGRTTM